MDNCGYCRLYNDNSYPLEGDGKKGALIMVVGDYPNEDDYDNNRIFSTGMKGFHSGLRNRGISLDDIYFTNAVKCLATSDKDVSSTTIKACNDLLQAEIEVINPRIIVPLGNVALKAVMNRTGISKHRGRAVEVGNRIYLPMYHPRMSLRYPLYKQFIVKDLDTLVDLIKQDGIVTQQVGYKSLETVDSALEAIHQLKTDKKMLAFDIETTGIEIYLPKSKIVSISLSNKVKTGYSIPLYHRQTPFKTWETGIIVKQLRLLLGDPTIPKAAHNGKFDMEWLKFWLDCPVANFCFDTMLAHYIAVTEEQGTHDLKGLAWEYTDMGGYDNALDEYKTTLPEAERTNYDNIPWDILKIYSAADADCCLRLENIFKPLIDANSNWKNLLDSVYIPASYAFGQVQNWGMHMDLPLAVEYKDAYKAEIDRLNTKLHNYPEVLDIEREKRDLYIQRQELLKAVPARERTDEQKEFIKTTQKYKDYQFNFNSTTQLKELLLDKIGLETNYKTDKGEPSLKEEALKEMKHEVTELLLDFRKVNTLNNMFIEKLPAMADPEHIVHPSFLLHGTVTSRTASENPEIRALGL